jgi:UDP-glucuronate 4-epimerase
MRIMVTGAAGFIGSHLAERLARLGHEVVGLDCFTDYYPRVLKDRNANDVRASGARLLECDLASDSLEEALEGVTAVYHLAAQPGISAATSLDTYLRNNVVATDRLLQACLAKGGIDLFANIATSSVYGYHATEPESVAPRPVSHYGVTKLAAEAMVLGAVESHGFAACSFRLFSVYGPRERPEKLFPRLIGAILQDTEFPLYEGAATHSRSFTFTRDIVDGLVLALDDPERCRGQIFNIGSDSEFATLDAIRIVEELLDRKARIRNQPGRPGDQLRTSACIDKIRDRLGYTPRVGLETGLAETVAWFKRQLPIQEGSN